MLGERAHLNELCYKDFRAIVPAKHSYFLGIAKFHQGQECKGNVKHGESLANNRVNIRGRVLVPD